MDKKVKVFGHELLLMRKFNYLFFVGATFFSLHACQNNHQKTDQAKLNELITISIDEEGFDKDESVELSSVVKDVEYYKFQLPSNMLIGQVHNFLVDEARGRVFISDKLKLFVFSLKGELLKIIQDVGQAPFEFREITYIDYDTESGHLAIYDQGGPKVLFYDESLTFIESKRLDFPPHPTFGLLANGYMSFCFGNLQGMPGTNGNLIIIDPQINLVGNYIPITDDKSIGEHFYSRSGIGKLNYTQPYNDTIYSFTEDNVLEARYAFDFGNFAVPAKSETLSAADILYGGKYANRVGHIYMVQETNDLLVFRYINEGVFKFYFYDKKNGLSNFGRLTDDINSGLSQKYYVLSDQKFYSLAFPERLEQLNVKLGYSNDGEGSDEQIVEDEALLDTANPFLLVMSLKK